MTDLEAQLRALGVPTNAGLATDEAIFCALVDGWKTNQKCPTATAIAGKLKLAPHHVTDVLGKLVAQGRVLRVRRGVWVPVVTR